MRPAGLDFVTRQYIDTGLAASPYVQYLQQYMQTGWQQRQYRYRVCTQVYHVLFVGLGRQTFSMHKLGSYGTLKLELQNKDSKELWNFERILQSCKDKRAKELHCSNQGQTAAGLYPHLQRCQSYPCWPGRRQHTPLSAVGHPLQPSSLCDTLCYTD